MIRDLISHWPAVRQATEGDPLGGGITVKSTTQSELLPRAATADKVVKSVCPYCGVGCVQNLYVKDDEIVQVEGDPDSPVNRGRLCPEGAGTLELATGPSRRYQVLYRPPYGKDWERLPLKQAMDMVAERVIETRRGKWQAKLKDEDVNRTMDIASLGGATLDNEENYLIKKLLTALGVVQVENQARLCRSATVAGLGPSFGRGGATTAMQDLQHSDCIVIEGSSFAEAHPVGFQWVMEAKARGATLIHVDPRFSRTSALADIHVPIRAGSDIAFLGGIIHYVLDNDKWFEDYVVNYTNAPQIIRDDYQDTEDLDGLFSGLHEAAGAYENEGWLPVGMNQVTDPEAGDGEDDPGYEERLQAVKDAGTAETHGAGGAGVHGRPETDPTLQHPRCVFQLLRRHYARYTPDLVERVCGIPQDLFRKVCEAVTSSPRRDRTTSFVYAVGWTQHSDGSQFIRAASVLQLLLGNIGRPGGGIQALRGHASIQGSTATNDFCYDYLPRITGSHSTYDTVMNQLAGECKGYFLMGENPAVGSANAKMQRLGMAHLDWLVARDHPTEGSIAEPSAEAVLAEIDGWDSEGSPLASYEQLNEDGSTACGCWIYCGVYAEGMNQAARRKPAKQQNWLGGECGWAWPANRRILYNRASADLNGKPWSERKALVWWDEETALWTGHDVADFTASKSPHYRPPEGATRGEALSGIDPFVMQAGGKGWIFAPAGLVDGPLPTHYEPQESPVANPLYKQQRSPVRQIFRHEQNCYHPSAGEAGWAVYPHVVTTFRLTEHFTAGGMSRWSSHLSELQPEMFCEVSPELAEGCGLEHQGWATVITARNAIEVRVRVTPRMTPLVVDGHVAHQVGLPFHWGTNGFTRGDAANDLTSIVLDANVHIQEVKALTAAIVPGRRPTGQKRVELVKEYRRRAGITEETGTEVLSV